MLPPTNSQLIESRNLVSKLRRETMLRGKIMRQPIERETTMAINTEKLAEIEAMLTDDVLTDEELVDRLRAAGLREVARVLDGAVRR